MKPKRVNREKKKRFRVPSRLGALMARLPNTWPVLYPLYLAAQLDLVEDQYWSAQVPEPFSGFKIAFVSDIHFGPLFSESRVRDLARQVNALAADLVILGGDYGVNSGLAVDFFRLKPGFRAGLGVLAVLGNHDRTYPESNFENLLQAMREDGVTPLVNDCFFVQRDGVKLAVAGTDDYYCGEPDLQKIAALSRSAAFTVYAAHEPDILPEAAALPGGPFYQLALCGHTHGGQVSVLGHAVKSPSMYGDRYLSGWYRENGADIMVSNGVGTTGLPVRLGARPQYHLITLRKE